MSTDAKQQFGSRIGNIGKMGFGGQGMGQRLFSFAPRLKSNAMVMGRFMPDTMDIVNNVECGAGTAIFVPRCLSVGQPLAGLSLPKTTGGGFGGLAAFGTTPKATHIQSIWGLYDSKMDPQMFMTITEKTATVGTSAVKMLEVEFAKNKPTAMTLTVYKGQATKQIATTFPIDAGYAKFTWQKA